MTNAICKLTGQPFEISSLEAAVLKKMGLKDPWYCPKVRRAMGLAFRNERNFFLRKCDATGERIISVFSEKKPFPVYKFEYWITDQWEAPQLDYDFNRPFFDQFIELSNKTPRPHGFSPYNENCDYCNAAEKNKNCYLHILGDRCENCYYTHGVFGSRDCIDSAYVIDSELCYESVDCRNCYHCRMALLCDNSSDLDFCFDMRGCRNCFMSFGLQNQQYCIQNKPVSKEEYEKKIGEINFESPEVFQLLKEKFIKEVVQGKPYVRMINTENSDGNFLINTKNCHHCYDVENAEDCEYYVIGSNGCKDVVHSHAIVDGSQLIYGNVSTTESFNCHNVIGCWTTRDSAYGNFLQGCQECIGCISLRHKKFCVLNKQYSEQEYQKIKAHIMNELGEYWGNPFPFKCAPLDYMESAFRDYDTFTKEEVKKVGWQWGEEKESAPAEGKPFRVIEQEAALLKKIGAPLPTIHPEIRFRNRVQFRKAPHASV